MASLTATDSWSVSEPQWSTSAQPLRLVKHLYSAVVWSVRGSRSFRVASLTIVRSFVLLICASVNVFPSTSTTSESLILYSLGRTCLGLAPLAQMNIIGFFFFSEAVSATFLDLPEDFDLS